MNQDLINRYQSGGDIYFSFVELYGVAAADTIALAALSGDETQINDALSNVRFGTPLPTSSLSIFGNQLATDPLGAPLQSLNHQVKSFFSDLLDNKALLAAIIVGLFLMFGGGTWVRRMLTGGR